jgi:glutamate 5-kinase
MASTVLRQQVLCKARRLVVKVGSQLLAHPKGGLDLACMKAIADQVAELDRRGVDVTLVSSGAISTGLGVLKMPRKPKDIAALQAVAAVGQIGLMDRWHELFGRRGIEVAQILLTRDDVEHRKRYLNIRNCIAELHRIHALPIINENDSVSVDEIRLGDNDILAAMVANALPADALVLLSVVDGLHDPSGGVVDIVHDVAAARAMAGEHKSTLGSGGMKTKLEAARMVTDAGEVAVIANGREKDVLLRLVAGEKLGTVFVPATRKLPSRRRWIGQAVRPAGTIVVDDGAAKAVARDGRSLLATGITQVVGVFEKGDVVVVRDGRGMEIARGLINYHSDEARAIMGKRSSQFEKVLGRKAYDEVIHRDNLVVSQQMSTTEATE